MMQVDFTESFSSDTQEEIEPVSRKQRQVSAFFAKIKPGNLLMFTRQYSVLSMENWKFNCNFL